MPFGVYPYKGGRDMNLITLRTDGTVVNVGDVLTDFRGAEWVFINATRAQEPGKSGKVIVRRNGSKREFYDRVFGVTVVSVPTTEKE